MLALIMRNVQLGAVQCETGCASDEAEVSHQAWCCTEHSEETVA